MWFLIYGLGVLEDSNVVSIPQGQEYALFTQGWVPLSRQHRTRCPTGGALSKYWFNGCIYKPETQTHQVFSKIEWKHIQALVFQTQVNFHACKI